MKRGDLKVKKISPTAVHIKARPAKDETPEEFAKRLAQAYAAFKR